MSDHAGAERLLSGPPRISAAELAAGSVLEGRYEVVRLIGQGDFSLVMDAPYPSTKQ